MNPEVFSSITRVCKYLLHIDMSSVQFGADSVMALRHLSHLRRFTGELSVDSLDKTDRIQDMLEELLKKTDRRGDIDGNIEGIKVLKCSPDCDRLRNDGYELDDDDARRIAIDEATELADRYMVFFTLMERRFPNKHLVFDDDSFRIIVEKL
jgi:hypothetical protein